MTGNIQWDAIDPYSGITASQVTSNVLDLRDALSWSMSWSTTSGTTSTHTIQLSNSSVKLSPDPNAIPNASFVNYTTFGTGTPAVIFGDVGARYARVLRTASGASVTLEFAKQFG